MIAGPQPMDPTEVTNLVYTIFEDPDSECLSECLIYGPSDMFSTPGFPDLSMTQAVSIGDTVGGHFEEARNRLDRRNAQTHEGVEGEMVPLIEGEDGWIQRQVHMKKNLVSARSLPIRAASEYAGIPMIGPNEAPVLKITGKYESETILQPWQPTAIAWMLAQEDTLIYGAILADACGLGKTVTALCLVYFTTLKLQAEGEKRKFRPTLIVVPASVPTVGGAD